MTRGVLALAVVAALIALLAPAEPPATAITRERANAIALRVFKPQREEGPVVVFGLPAPLGAKQSVTVAGPQRLGLVKAKGKLKALGASTWLYWEDLHYGALFQHPSKLLLVDGRSGKTELRRISWYPLVDGLRPAFLRTRAAFYGRTYRVFSRLGNVRRPSASAVPAIPRRTTSALPEGAFVEDCMIMIGPTRDPFFEKNFPAMAEFARSVGLRAFYATEGSNPRTEPPVESDQPGGSDLALNVERLISRENCKDVFIYVAGHGNPPSGGPPSVVVGEGKTVVPSDLLDIAKSNRETTFKIKIDSCHSGRFLEKEHGLTERANILLIEAAAQANEFAYNNLGNETDLWVDPSGRKVKRKVDNPELLEFTHANIAGMTEFASSAAEVNSALDAGGSLLARMLKRGFELGQSSNMANLSGMNTPRIHYDLPAQFLTVVNRESHTHPSPNPGFSYVCKEATSEPGTSLTLTVTGPGGFNQTTSFPLPWGVRLKTHVFSYKITKIGEYVFKVTAKRGTRTVTQESRYTVPGSTVPTGPFPCPPPP